MHMPWKCLLSVVLIAAPAVAQPARPPGERRINPAAPTEGTGSVTPVPAGAKKPNCEELRKKARYNIYFDKVEIEKLVQTVSDATCKTFILPENIRGKISIIGPENGKVEVNGEQFYAAFLAALDANSLAVYEHGRFLKIVDKQRAKQFPIPTITDPTVEYTTNEQMVTRMFKVKYVEIEQLRGVLQQLVTPSGDTIPFQPDTIIINDLGSNMHRLEKVVEQLDSRSSSDQVQIIQIQYATHPLGDAAIGPCLAGEELRVGAKLPLAVALEQRAHVGLRKIAGHHQRVVCDRDAIQLLERVEAGVLHLLQHVALPGEHALDHQVAEV